MKKILILLVFMSQTAFSQDFTLFKVAVVFKDGTRQQGVFYDVNETEVVLTPDALNLKETLKSGNVPVLTRINLKDSTIKGIFLRRKGFVGRNFLGSVAILSSVGIIAGYLRGDDKYPDNWFLSWEEKSFLLGALGFIGSVGTTPIISLFPKKKIYQHQIHAGETDNILEKFSLRWQKENRKNKK